MTDWHPRRLAHPVRWVVLAPGRSEPLGWITRTVTEDRAVYAVRTGFDNEPLGPFASGDEAAAALWRAWVEMHHRQHEIVSRLHGGAERGGPAARA